MKYIVRTLVGVLYMLTKYIILAIATIVLVIWDLSFENLEELWQDHRTYYIKTIFCTIEEYRYDTLMDFILNRKNYQYADTNNRYTK